MASGDVLVDFQAAPKVVTSQGSPAYEFVQVDGTESKTEAGSTRNLVRQVTLNAELHGALPIKESAFSRDKQYRVQITEV